MRVVYIRRVKEPYYLAGNSGDEKDIGELDALRLINQGYCKKIEKERGQKHAGRKEGRQAEDTGENQADSEGILQDRRSDDLVSRPKEPPDAAVDQ